MKSQIITYSTALAVLWAVAMPAQTTAPLSHLERGKQFIGKNVRSTDNKRAGKVDDVIVDLTTGRILYVVVKGSNKRLSIPPALFSNTQDTPIRVNLDESKLEAGTEFTSAVDTPQTINKADYVSKVYKSYDQQAWWAGANPAEVGTFNNVHKVSDLVGMKVINVNGNDIGKVDNVALDMAIGRVAFVLLDPDSSLKLGSDLYALPPDAFTWNADKKALSSDIDQQKLTAAPHFAKDNWSQLTDRTFASKVYQYYGKQAYFGLQPTGR